MTFNKIMSICNHKHHPWHELVLPGQTLGPIEQRFQVIILFLDKIVFWGMTGLVGFVRDLTEVQIIKHDNFIYQSLPDGYSHRCPTVW